eukprot:TRINITY_DN1683_c2_g1_i2.p1 TRINITY_DN1683_c2_g1~~TRINITY_DN1683_c2_g1_i2.p1  ORF type:complete len:402 (-),score=184.71 TRINITY_DN1683_c2_g1_i2:22-1227(-)
MSFTYRVKSYATPTKKQRKEGLEEKNVVSSQALRRTQKLRFDEVDVDSADFAFNSRGLLKPRKSPAKPAAALPVKSNSPVKRAASSQPEESSSPVKRGRGRPPTKAREEKKEEEEEKEEKEEEEEVESSSAIVLPSKKTPIQRLIFPILASEAKSFQESEDSEEWLENSCNECARIFLESVATYPKDQMNSLLKNDGSLRQPVRKMNPEAQAFKKREDSLNLLIKSYERELEAQKEMISYYSKSPAETSIFPAPSQPSKIPKLGEKKKGKGRKSVSTEDAEKEDDIESNEFDRYKIFEQVRQISFESNEMRSTLLKIQKKVEDNEESYKTWAEFLKREGFKDFDLEADPRNLIKGLTQATPTATPATTPATTPFRSNHSNQQEATQSPFRSVFTKIKERLF